MDKELASNANVGMVSLTGSVESGVKIMEAAAKNIIKVSLELGGKAPAIVWKELIYIQVFMMSSWTRCVGL